MKPYRLPKKIKSFLQDCLNSVWIQTMSGFRKKTQGLPIYIARMWVGLKFTIIPTALFLITYSFHRVHDISNEKSIISAGLALCSNSVWILFEFRQIQTISGFRKKAQGFPIRNKDVCRFEIYYNSSGAFPNNLQFSSGPRDFKWKSIILAGRALRLNSVWIQTDSDNISFLEENTRISNTKQGCG